MQKTKIGWYIKIFGLCTSIVYMVVILHVWISAELGGYTYFSAGEPNHIIKFSEWIFGIIGIYTLMVITKDELYKHASTH